MQNRFGSVTHQTARATFRDDQIGNDLTPRSETRARGAHEHRSRTRIVPFARARATNERRAADGRRRTPRALGSVVIEFSLKSIDSLAAMSAVSPTPTKPKNAAPNYKQRGYEQGGAHRIEIKREPNRHDLPAKASVCCFGVSWDDAYEARQSSSYTLVPIGPRPRRELQSLRTFSSVASLRSHHGVNPRFRLRLTPFDSAPTSL